MNLSVPVLGTVNFPVSQTGAPTNDTVWAGVIPPMPGIQQVSGNNKVLPQGRTVLTNVTYSTQGTAHVVTIARPFNYTWITVATAANGTTLTLFDDPGLYSTKYKYSTPGGTAPAQAANNAIAGNDYVVVQLADGSWVVRKITSVAAGPPIVLTIPNLPNNGIGAAVGAPVYFYGTIVTDVNPRTGVANPSTTMAASTTRQQWFDYGIGILSAYNTGDPLLASSPNGTAFGTFDSISGYYARF